MSTNRRMITIMIYHIMHNKKNEKFYSIEMECSLRYIADKEIECRKCVSYSIYYTMMQE